MSHLQAYPCRCHLDCVCFCSARSESSLWAEQWDGQRDGYACSHYVCKKFTVKVSANANISESRHSEVRDRMAGGHQLKRLPQLLGQSVHQSSWGEIHITVSCHPAAGDLVCLKSNYQCFVAFWFFLVWGCWCHSALSFGTYRCYPNSKRNRIW